MKLTGRWFPQIVDMDSGNLYPIYIYKTKIEENQNDSFRFYTSVPACLCLRDKYFVSKVRTG